MRLQEIIDELKKHDASKHLKDGFATPHSYRGYYDQLAFKPARDTTVGAMLDAAERARGETFTGWKGGEYTMSGRTNCWLAEIGEASGVEITPELLASLLGVMYQPDLKKKEFLVRFKISETHTHEYTAIIDSLDDIEEAIEKALDQGNYDITDTDVEQNDDVYDIEIVEELVDGVWKPIWSVNPGDNE